MKKLPPFSKLLFHLLASGQRPLNDVYCFCGYHAWQKAKAFSKYQFVLCLPPYEDPAIYRWPVKNCDILLFGTGYIEAVYIEEFVYILLKYNARIVRAINSDFEIAVFHRETA
jgi:hypothetical protein